MNPYLLILLAAVAGYLLGGVPFGYLIALRRGVNLFDQGSGNIGATNAGRVLGKRFGFLVFFLDFAKGAAATAFGLWCQAKMPVAWQTDTLAASTPVAAGLASILGHMFSIYLKFRGGKGVATGAGVVVVLLPIPAALAVFSWVFVLSATRYISLASMVAAAVLCAAQLGIAADPYGAVEAPLTIFCAVTAVLVFVRHHSNIVNLYQGTEPPLNDSPTLLGFNKIIHVFAVGLWFGSSAFFLFVVTLSLFATFENYAQQPAAARPNWFPQPAAFHAKKHHIAEFEAAKEQGTRAAGRAVGPMFTSWFLLQGLCGFLAVGASIGWSQTMRGKVHKRRVVVLLAALATVVIGWGLERKVNSLRTARDLAVDGYLHSTPQTAQLTLEKMKADRSEFGRWHGYSLLAAFATMALVTVAMGMTAFLPAKPMAEESISPGQRNAVLEKPLAARRP